MKPPPGMKIEQAIPLRGEMTIGFTITYEDPWLYARLRYGNLCALTFPG